MARAVGMVVSLSRQRRALAARVLVTVEVLGTVVVPVRVLVLRSRSTLRMARTAVDDGHLRAYDGGMDRKLPWRWTHDVDADDEDRMGIILDAGDEVVARDLTLDDAAFLVEAANVRAGIVCTCEWDDACPFHPSAVGAR